MFILLAACCLMLTSCAGIARRPQVPIVHAPVISPNLPPVIPIARHELKHVVGPGETFWRISKMYDVPQAAIMEANHIHEAVALKMGQILTIPNALPQKPVVNLYPSQKWRYIIIHHSATDNGSSLRFHKAHLAKGWDKGVGYDFVIDNDSEGKVDGQIEETPRWIKQIDGAHCKASDMNMKAIGICLVGNFNTEKVTARQMESLVYLVQKLQAYYNIPTSNIIRHGHVQGASTDCPGKKFPWKEFLDNLGR